MNPKITTALFVLSAATASILGWLFYLQREELRGLKETLDATKLESAAALQESRTSLEKLRMALAQAEASARARVAPATAAATPAPRADPAAPAGSDHRQRALQKVDQEGQLSFSYAAMFRELKLPIEKLERLKSMMVERQFALTDAREVARSQNITRESDPAAYQKITDRIYLDSGEEMKQLIGEDAYIRLMRFQETLPQQSTARLLEQYLMPTDTPLTDAQAKEMVAILKQTSPGLGRGEAQITDETVERAKAVLSPQQTFALKRLQEQQKARTELQTIRTRSRG